MPSSVHPPHEAQKPRIWLRVRAEDTIGVGGSTSFAMERAMTVGNYIKKRPGCKKKRGGNWDSLGTEGNVRARSACPTRGCGIFHENKFWPKSPKPDRLGGPAGFRIKFIFVDLAETLVQSGFRKSGLRKIRFSKNLDIKILRTNSLAGRFRAGRTVTASTMIAQVWWRAQGQMSQGGVEKGQASLVHSGVTNYGFCGRASGRGDVSDKIDPSPSQKYRTRRGPSADARVPVPESPPERETWPAALRQFRRHARRAEILRPLAGSPCTRRASLFCVCPWITTKENAPLHFLQEPGRKGSLERSKPAGSSYAQGRCWRYFAACRRSSRDFTSAFNPSGRWLPKRAKCSLIDGTSASHPSISTLSNSST